MSSKPGTVGPLLIRSFFNSSEQGITLLIMFLFYLHSNLFCRLIVSQYYCIIVIGEMESWSILVLWTMLDLFYF